MRQIFSLLILICVITTAIEAQPSTAGAAPAAASTETQDRVEQWRGKTVMVFTPCDGHQHGLHRWIISNERATTIHCGPHSPSPTNHRAISPDVSP
jgi:hypothetical protein